MEGRHKARTTEKKFDFEREEQNRIISMLETENISLKLALEEKEEKITELDKWVSLLSDSANVQDEIR